jgi:hypothetical protein
LIYLEFWSAPSASPAVRGMLWGVTRNAQVMT